MLHRRILCPLLLTATPALLSLGAVLGYILARFQTLPFLLHQAQSKVSLLVFKYGQNPMAVVGESLGQVDVAGKESDHYRSQFHWKIQD